MILDPKLTLLLAELPESLDQLLPALADESAADGRPWLPVLGAFTAENASLWLLVLEAVAPLLASDDFVTQHMALKVVARCPLPQAGQLAAPFLADSRSIFAVTASDAVARSGVDAGREGLEAQLAYPTSDVRLRAAGNLGVVGDPAAAYALRQLIERGDEEPLVLRWAAVSLGELGSLPDQRLLERLAQTTSNAFVREGVRVALDSMGVQRDDLALVPEFTEAVRGAAEGEPEGLQWLLARYRDARLAESVRGALLNLPRESDAQLLVLLEGASRSQRFPLADLLGWRGVDAARAPLRALRDAGYDPPGLLAAGCALVRLGDPDAAGRFRARWFEDVDAPDRANEISQALALQAPLPSGFLRVLLADPCAFVCATAAVLVGQAGRTELLVPLQEALALESGRVEGSEPPRDAEENEFASAKSHRASIIAAGGAVRAFLPPSVRDAAERLEETELLDPHVLAARSLLNACVGFGELPLREAAESLFGSSSALLRFDALKLWASSVGRLPEYSFENDANETVRSLWSALRS